MFFNDKIIVQVDSESLLLELNQAIDYELLLFLIKAVVKKSSLLYSCFEFDNESVAQEYEDILTKHNGVYSLSKLPKELGRLVLLYANCSEFSLFSVRNNSSNEKMDFKLSPWDTEAFVRQQDYHVGMYTNYMDDILSISSSDKEMLHDINNRIVSIQKGESGTESQE